MSDEALLVQDSYEDTPSVYRYGELADNAEPGTRIFAWCRYQDVAEGEVDAYSRFITYGVDPPVEYEAALAGWRQRIELALRPPEVVSRPSLTNQRVGFEAWFGFPTFNPPPPLDDGVLALSVDPSEVRATLRVPVPGRDDMVVDCSASGVGADGRPDGVCSGTFHWSTRGTVQATVSIVYPVRFSSPLTGETDVPLGEVTMSSTVDVDVRDLQATAD